MIKIIFQAVLFAAAFAATGLASAAPVGYVHEVKGDVTLRDAGKPPVKATAGDVFEQGANFTTGADGVVTLKFEDGQIAALSPNSQFIASTYVYDKKKIADSNVVFSLVRGGLRFISGAIATTSNSKFSIRTPTATAGVRGTIGDIVIDVGTGATLVVSSQGDVTFTSGGVTVTVPAGTQSFTAAGGGAPSSAGVPVPPALAALAATARVLALLNTPAPSPVAAAATGVAIKAAAAAAANPGNAALQAEAARTAEVARIQTLAAADTALRAGAISNVNPLNPTVKTDILPILIPVPIPCVPSPPGSAC